jgi:hypothetical protein
MNRLNSHFFRSFPTRSRDVLGDGQSPLVDKLGVGPSRSRLLRSTSLLPGDSTVGSRLRFWDVRLTLSQQPIYSLLPTVYVNIFEKGDTEVWPVFRWPRIGHSVNEPLGFIINDRKFTGQLINVNLNLYISISIYCRRFLLAIVRYGYWVY